SAINFNANISSLDSVAYYQWSFGDGNTSTDPMPVYTYSAAGIYTVKLKITTLSGCIDSFELPRAVIVNEKPVAGFSAAPRDACAYTDIQFTDSSTNDVISWVWFFGDGSTSLEKNPLHEYNDTGRFTVTLRVFNNGCSDTLIVFNYIHIKPPVASFISSLDCDNPLLRTFTDKSVAPETWSWDFGDGDTALQKSPSHHYADTGVYNVQLIVTNGECADTTITPVYIIDEKPQFEISSPGSSLCRHDLLKFTGTNYNPGFITNFKWMFGDGTSTGFSPALANTTHIYQHTGSYTPILITIDLNGCYDTAINASAIDIYGPTAIFSNPEGTCHDSSIVFSDESITDGIHPLTQWVWNYGDGITDILNKPPFQHSYTNAGVYDVKLIVYDSIGCTDTLLKPDDVIITRPIADFDIQDSIRCTFSKVLFTNFSQGLPLSYAWNFGDGSSSSLLNPAHIYSTEGSYTVSLSVTDRFGCTDTLIKPGGILVANPVAAFTISDS
ncbi:MAG TPA: PKD domain-containing protein, partial [Panacibacter sp.]|nr:PKD domain-containing protein [Panacibacter sp.]